jgi:hypothetical protein
MLLRAGARGYQGKEEMQQKINLLTRLRSNGRGWSNILRYPYRLAGGLLWRTRLEIRKGKEK